MRNSSVSVHIIQPGFFTTNINDPMALTNKLEKAWDRMPESHQQFYGKQCIDESKCGTDRVNLGTIIIILS